jgi:hypothetical protein
MTRGLLGNWTFNKEDDFTLPNGDYKTLPTDSLERIHNEFAKECKIISFISTLFCYCFKAKGALSP